MAAAPFSLCSLTPLSPARSGTVWGHIRLSQRLAESCLPVPEGLESYVTVSEDMSSAPPAPHWLCSGDSFSKLLSKVSRVTC